MAFAINTSVTSSQQPEPKPITIDPDAIPEDAVDRLVELLGQHFAEIEYRKQE